MLELSQYTVDYLVGLAEVDPTREVCGLILKNQTVHPILNIAQKPEHRFEMDPIQQLEAIQAFSAEKLGDQIMGMYHSHPSGNPVPSNTDKEGWPPEGWGYWIISAGKVVEWRLEGGRLFRVKSQEADSTRKLVGTLPWGSGGS